MWRTAFGLDSWISPYSWYSVIRILILFILISAEMVSIESLAYSRYRVLQFCLDENVGWMILVGDRIGLNKNHNMFIVGMYANLNNVTKTRACSHKRQENWQCVKSFTVLIRLYFHPYFIQKNNCLFNLIGNYLAY